MPDLASLEEYESRFKQNHRLTGRGIDGTTSHFPCPFCAERDWYVVQIVNFARSTGPIYCQNCDRAARLVYSERDGVSSMELLQVSGPDAPSWMDPAPKREQVKENEKDPLDPSSVEPKGEGRLAPPPPQRPRKRMP